MAVQKLERTRASRSQFSRGQFYFFLSALLFLRFARRRPWFHRSVLHFLIKLEIRWLFPVRRRKTKENLGDQGTRRTKRRYPLVATVYRISMLSVAAVENIPQNKNQSLFKT